MSKPTASGRRQALRRRQRRRTLALAVVALAGSGLAYALAASPDTDDETAPLVTTDTGDARREARLDRLEAAVAREEKRIAAQSASVNGMALDSFERLAVSLDAEIGIAYAPIGRGEAETLGELQSGSAWSTIKVPLAGAAIARAGGPGALSSAQRAQISSALRASDNAAAMTLWEGLGGGAGAARSVEAVLAEGGDTATAVSTVGRDGFSPYGQTDWTLGTQAMFMGSLAAGCVTGASYLMGELGQVVADQSWGLGEAGSAAFKGGWGPGTDGGYLVRQMGALPMQGGEAAVAIAALPADGSFESGQAALGEVARWAADELRAPARSAC